MTVHDGTVDGTVEKLQKDQEWHFDPKMAIWAFSSSFLNSVVNFTVDAVNRHLMVRRNLRF
jgi:hypothetical protein